jgi:SAM-dependent methyltransferase
MTKIVDSYLDPKVVLNIIDIGSFDVCGTYKPLFLKENWKYVGVDMSAGPNVDMVVDGGYEWSGINDNSYDIVISGQALEHMEYPWLAAKAMYRVCKVGGICAVIAPCVWGYHPAPKDCFRFYPDGMRSLFIGTAGFTELECSMEGTDTWFVGKK